MPGARWASSSARAVILAGCWWSRSRSASPPRSASRPTTPTPSTSTRSTCCVESDAAPFPLVDPPPTDVDRAIASHAAAFIGEGATLQTGIGSVPSTLVGLLADGDRGDFGVHSEMFTTGLMQLHESGKVSNRKGLYDGVSVATFAAGTEELYDWLRGNQDVAFLPVEVINSPDVIGRNRLMTTINGAMSLDIHGQVIADTIGGNQFSGIGGHEDFVSGPALQLEDRSLLCLPSTVTIGEEVRSRIVPWFERRRGHHDSPPPGGRDRHRVRGRRAPGQDDPPAGGGARRDRPPGLPRRPARGRRARLGRRAPRAAS